MWELHWVVSVAGMARTCVSGQTCQVDGLVGHYLSDTDMVAVMDTCGVASTLPRFPQFGFVLEMHGIEPMQTLVLSILL